MPFIHVAWLPKACRTPEIRKEVASVGTRGDDESDTNRAPDTEEAKIKIISLSPFYLSFSPATSSPPFPC